MNLTCSKTHILAWANSDDTLSLKINGVKYLGYPRQDKKGERYWKVDTLITSALNSEANPQLLTLEESYQAKLKAGKKMSDFSKEELDAHHKFKEQERLKEQKESIGDQSQKVLAQLAQKITNHEPNPT